MAGMTLEDILGYQNLTGIIQDPKGLIPADILPTGFQTMTRSVEGDTASYTQVKGDRRLAQLAERTSPSKRVNMKGIKDVPVKLAFTNEHIIHDVTILQQLRQFDSPMLQERGRQVIAQRTGMFRDRLNNLRLACVYAALTKGYLWFDGNGNLLPTSAGAVTTVNFQIPAANLDNSNIGAWNTASTDIASQLNAERERMEKWTGYTPTTIMYGSNIPGYLATNDIAKTLLQAQPMAQVFAQTGRPPNGLFDFNWVRGTRLWFEDQTGTIQTLMGANQIVMLPEPSLDWYEMLQGSFLIPTNLGGVSADAGGVLDSLAKVYGMFSYAKVQDDPISIKHVHGDTFLPCIKVPGAVRIVTNVTSAATTPSAPDLGTD